MPVVNIARPASSRVVAGVMGVKVENEPLISFVTSPVTIKGSPGVWKISETDRPGRKPITQASAPGLEVVQFEHQIASLNPYVSIEHLIIPIRAAAKKGKRVQFLNGGMLSSGTWWWIKSLDIAEDMKAADNRTSRATLSWDCVEANGVTGIELTKTGVKPGTVTNGTPPGPMTQNRPRNPDGSTRTGTGYNP